MKRKLIFSLIVALLLTPWPVAYAHDEAMATNTPMTVEAAETAATPKLNAFGNAIGGVTPGDLFYIDSADSSADALITLYITNTDELVQHYRYMTLNVGIYVQTGIDQWEKTTWGESETPREIYITMQGGMTSFVLPGYARYRITIDKGCFYCYGMSGDNNAVSPEFYLTVS